MRTACALLTSIMLMTILVFSTGRIGAADELKVVGVITRVELAGEDARTAAVVMKDTRTGKAITITINDSLTLDKLKDQRIVTGDEIRCKYEVREGKNVSTYFRKTAGC